MLYLHHITPHWCEFSDFSLNLGVIKVLRLDVWRHQIVESTPSRPKRHRHGLLQHFGHTLDLAVAIYVDYLIKPDTVRSMLRSVTATVSDLQRVSPLDLGFRA